MEKHFGRLCPFRNRAYGAHMISYAVYTPDLVCRGSIEDRRWLMVIEYFLKKSTSNTLYYINEGTRLKAYHCLSGLNEREYKCIRSRLRSWGLPFLARVSWFQKEMGEDGKERIVQCYDIRRGFGARKENEDE